MKAFLTGTVLAIIIAIGAGFVLDDFQTTAPQAFTKEGARITSPGDNLVVF